MFRAYNLVVRDPNLFSKWYGNGRAAYDKARLNARHKLEDFLVGHALDGTRLSEDWFSLVDSEIFISHSHSDEELAIGLAGLFHSLGIRCFIDSMVWGNAVDLNRDIDNKYCLSWDRKHYDYNKRNYSTSHVHMMLASALVEMIDRAECVIFLNTPASVLARDSEVEERSVTASPWIYHELSTTKMIRRRRPSRVSMESRSLKEVFAREQGLEITYDVPLGHLRSLSFNQISSIASQGLYGTDVLDRLYELS